MLGATLVREQLYAITYLLREQRIFWNYNLAPPPRQIVWAIPDPPRIYLTLECEWTKQASILSAVHAAW